jgi:DNA-binding MurR/RpiR family transcriptional regulator
MKGKGHGEKKSRKKDLAIINLLTEPTIKGAAEKTGISEATLWRWMQDDDFKEQYRDAKRETVGHATAKLRHGMTVAVDALVEMAENKKTPAVARASACRTLLEFGMKAHENEDLQERVEALEEQFKEEAEGNAS